MLPHLQQYNSSFIFTNVQQSIIIMLCERLTINLEWKFIEYKTGIGTQALTK